MRTTLVLAVLSFLAVAREARAADPVPKTKAEAEEAMRSGIDFYEEGNFAEAIVRFEFALKLVPDATGAVLMLAESYRKLGKCASAVPRYEEYVFLKSKRGEKPNPEAVVGLEYCTSKAAPRATIVTTPPGALVRLDSPTGTLVGETPVRDAAMPTGAHKLFIGKDGFAPAEAAFFGTLGETSEVNVTLARVYAIKVVTDLDGALVRVDGREIGRTPIVAPVPLTAGEHKIEMEKTGHPIVRTDVMINPETKEVHLGMPGVVPPSAALKDERSKKNSTLIIAVAAGAGGAVAIGVGVTLGVLLGGRPKPDLGRFGPGAD